MGKVAKSTKKFNKKSLTGELKRRRQNKQTKARFEKRRGNKGKDSVDEEAPEKKISKKKSGFGYQAITGTDEDAKNGDLFESLEKVEDEDYEDDFSQDDAMESDDNLSEASQDMDEDLNQDIEGHQKDLEDIKNKDPEFYDFLQKNDKNLLNFDLSDEDDDQAEDGDGQEDIEEDEVAESENETSDKKTTETKPPKSKKPEVIVDGELSITQIEAWEKQISETHCLKTARQMVFAFEAGAHLGEDSEAFNSRCDYKISSDRVFNRLMVGSLKTIPSILAHYLTDKKQPSLSPSRFKPWSKIQPMIKVFIHSIIYMYGVINTSDMQKYLLGSTYELLIYVACDAKITQRLLKSLLKTFSTSQDVEIQKAAFSLILRLTKLAPDSLNDGLKGVYAAFIQNSRAVNAYTITRLNVMRSCAVTLFGNNFNSSYQLAFSCIRQLAIHLRNSMVNKTKESAQKVYNWQFIQSIHFWTYVITTYCDHEVTKMHGDSPLQPLIYPLIQVALGAVSLIPSSKYFPLRFHCVRALCLIAQKTNTYIPVVPLLIEVLESIEFQRNPSPCTLKPFNMLMSIKTPKQYLRSRVYQDMLTEELLTFFLDYYSTLSKSISFPEVTIPTTIYLKKFIKNSKSIKINKSLEQLLIKVKATADLIKTQRSRIQFAPADIEKMTSFLSCPDSKTPIEEYYATVKKLKEERQALLQTADESD